MEQLLRISFKKKGSKLVISTKLEVEQYKIFLSSLNDGDVVDALFELKTMDSTSSQLAKIHVMIKLMALEQGSTIKEMKEQMKEECGMYDTVDGKKVYQSFAGRSKDDLSNAIETIIQKARFLNINLEGL